MNVIEDFGVLVELVKREIGALRGTSGFEESDEPREEMHAEHIEIFLNGKDENDELLIDDFLESVEFREEEVREVGAFLFLDTRVLVRHPNPLQVNQMNLLQHCRQRHEITEFMEFIRTCFVHNRTANIVEQGLHLSGLQSQTKVISESILLLSRMQLKMQTTI